MAKIMLVDDEQDMLLLIRSMLTSMGYDVVGLANSGEQAVQMARDLKPDLILMDIKMPGHLDGIAAAEQIRLELDIAIVFLTGYATQQYIERAKRVEPFGYVMKPFSNDGLRASIEIALCKNEIQKKQKNSNEELSNLNKKLETEIEAREKSEKKYKFLAENMVDIVWTVDRNLRTTYASPSIEKILGFTPEERKRQPLEEMLTPESLQKVQERLMEEIQRDKEGSADLDRSITMETEYYRRDGSTVWMENRFKMIRDPGNAFNGIIGVSRDITERKKAEKTIRRSEQKYRSLFENSPIGIATLDEERNILDCNDAMLDIHRYSREEDLDDIGNTSKYYHNPEVHEKVTSELSKNGFVNEMEIKLKREDGTPYDALLSMRPIEVGSQSLWHAIIQDISDRKRAEEALRESEELHRITIENIQDPVFITDSIGNFTFICPNIPHILGYSVAEIEAMGNVSVFMGENQSLFDLEDLNRLGEIPNVEAVIANKNGSKRDYLVTVKRVSIKGGTILYICRDITERKQAEDALTLIGKRFRAIIDASPVPMALNDEEQKITYLNPAFVQTFGYRQEDIPTLDLWWPKAYPDPKYRQWVSVTWQAELEQCKLIGTAFPSMELIIRCKNGETKTALVNAVSLTDSFEGEHLVVLYDITERKQAEEVFRKQNYYLQKAQELGKIGTWELDIINNILIWTDENCRIFGIPEGSVANYEIFLSKVHPDDREYVDREWKAAVEGKPYDIEHRLLLDGAVKWVREKANLEFDYNGKAISAIGFTQDVTEKKRAEEALRKSQEKYRDLVENINDVIFALDKTGNVSYVSPAIEKIIGYSPSEVTNRNMMEFIHPDDRAMLADRFRELITSGVLLPYEYRLKDKSGNTRWIRSSSRQVVQDGKTIGIQGVFIDITESKRLEEQLRQAQKMEAIGTLTGGIAHDYNNLMSIIMGNLSLAQEEAEPGSDLADFLNEANMASRKVRDLTHELMSLSKGGGPVREVGSLAKLLESVSELIPADSGISLTESISQDLKLVSYDRLKMGAVIRNLVKNAVEAMPDGGTLEIKAENLRIEDMKQDSCLILKPGDYVHISIQDQGNGIPEEHIDKIFDPYFSSKERGVQKGMGLGLTTAYAIVKQHGGHIQIDSSFGAGTTVNIYLPAESDPEQMDRTITSADDKTSPVKRLLIMDDEEMLRNLARQMLERMGYAVETVKDGLEAIEKYKKQKDSSEPFDAVILDLTIKGGMGGEQTMRELLKIDPDVKAIVSSGYFNDPVLANYEEHGFQGAMAKPYQKTDLESVLKTIL